MDDHRRISRRQAMRFLVGAAAVVLTYPLYRSLRGPMPRTRRRVELAGVTTERLQELLDGLVSRKEVQHAVIAVERRDGSSRWVGAAGVAHPGGAPMRADTPFFVASITKLYTAALVMKLHERGQLRLDHSISAYLPRTLIAGLHRLRGVDYTDAITVRHLLAHTSGLADYFADRPEGGRSLTDRLAAEGDMAWTLNELIDRVRDELTPHFPPQEPGARRPKIRYSDTNYQLLGAIVESVSGQPLQVVFEAQLFQPLGLDETYLFPYGRPGSAAEPATIWLQEEPWNVPLALGSLGADGGIVSTAAETIAFLRALMTGRMFEEPATLALMQQRWNRFGLPLDPVALRLPGWPIEYGLGMMRFRLPTVLNRLRPMPVLLGHTGSTGSWLFDCPELDVMLAGTVNQATAGALPYRFLPKLLRALDSASA